MNADYSSAPTTEIHPAKAGQLRLRAFPRSPAGTPMALLLNRPPYIAELPGLLKSPSPRPLALRRANGTGPGPNLQPLCTQTFSVRDDRSFLDGLLDGQTISFEIPLGSPRFINARTLKALLKARRSDVLFAKVGQQWEPCEDSQEIDLRDRSQVFRLGWIQIFS